MGWLSDIISNAKPSSGSNHLLPSGGLAGILDPANVHNRLDPLHLFPRDPTPGEQTLAQISQLAGEAAQPYLKAYETGTLTPAQKASVDLSVQGEKNQWNQFLASRGMGQSSALTQAMNLATQNGYDLTQKYLADDFKNAMALLGIASGNLSSLSALSLAGDKATADALTSAGQDLGTVLGSINSQPNDTPAGAGPPISGPDTPGSAGDTGGIV